MATVVDSLVLTLGLDASQFSSAQTKAVESLRKFEDESARSGRAIESQGARLNQFFSGLKSEVIGFAGLALGGMGAKQFLSFVNDLNTGFARLSSTTGISVHTLSQWYGMSKMVGGSGQDMLATMKNLEQEIYNFKFGKGSDLPGMLRAIDPLNPINPFDESGKPKRGDVILNETFEHMQRRIKDPVERGAFARALGYDETTVYLMSRTTEEFKKLREEADKLAPANARAAEDAMKLTKSLAGLELSATGAASALLGLISGPINSELQKMQRDIEAEPEREREFATLWRNRFANVLDWIGQRSGSSEKQQEWQAWAKSIRGGNSDAGPTGNIGIPGGGGTPNGNWTNFLSGLSYLETSQQGTPSSISTARGYFQFIQGTAAKARAAGLADPRIGSWDQQASATMDYIKHFYPEAAAAIESGDFKKATGMLRGEWPSLPGGSQPQSASRYRTWADELMGGGPRPPGSLSPIGTGAARSSLLSPRGGGNTSQTANISIDKLIVQTNKDDAEGHASEVKEALERQNWAAQANFSLNG